MTTVTALGPRLITLQITKTYASEVNAIRAVEKIFPATTEYNNLTYILQRTADNRFFPVFIGERALQAMAHHHFHVVA